MNESPIQQSSTTEGLPVAPSMGPAMEQSQLPTHSTPIDQRVLWICVLCVVVGAAAGIMAQALLRLIWFFTNLSFYGQLSMAKVVARDNHLGPWVILVPIAGALVIGFMLRYGSRAVAGHGIPEAMEQVLTNESRIPARMTFLKPFSAAISIGTGGPFGAEGPIIATGGALGSLLGQLLKTTPSERKTLLAAGAAAGIAAAFGSPVAAVLLAIELLLFEFRPRSIIPVALASAVAACLHNYYETHGMLEPMFQFSGPPPVAATEIGLLAYTLLGAIIGVGAVVMTRLVYAIEHVFEHHLHRIHWMWHPAIGAVAVGVIGYISPATLGPGYFNLNAMLAPHVALTAAAALCVLKLASWTISLGSGTAGGTLAPVFTIGGSMAVVAAALVSRLVPAAHMDPRMAALVGMVAIFAGASRALLTSVVFGFEVTLQPATLMPALCGCSAAYLVSAMLMQHSIMTEKMARQGVRVPMEYGADPLEQIPVLDAATSPVVTLPADQTVRATRQWLQSGEEGSEYGGYPLVDATGSLAGVISRREIADAEARSDARLIEISPRTSVVVFRDATLRDAANLMANESVGRVPVIQRANGRDKIIGILTRSDLLQAYGRRLRRSREARTSVNLFRRRRRMLREQSMEAMAAAADASSPHIPT